MAVITRTSTNEQVSCHPGGEVNESLETQLMNEYQYDRAGYLQACARAGLHIDHAARSYDEVMQMLAANAALEQMPANVARGLWLRYILVALLLIGACILFGFVVHQMALDGVRGDGYFLWGLFRTR